MVLEHKAPFFLRHIGANIGGSRHFTGNACIDIIAVIKLLNELFESADL
jgi:hypothetical protein